MIDFDHGGKIVRTTPFRQKNQRWQRMIGQAGVTRVKSEIHHGLASGIITTTWAISDWPQGFVPVFMALQDEEETAKCLGLLVSDCVLEREQNTGESWGFKHCEKDGVPIRGRTYFRLGTP